MYFMGLEGCIGPPSPDLHRAMAHEHAEGADARALFTAGGAEQRAPTGVSADVEAGERADGETDGAPRECRAAAWALSDAETLAWRGAAADACSQLRSERLSNGVYSSTQDPGWTYADQFRRDARFCSRQAMKAAGCSIERWSEAATSAGTGAIGGRWGGSGLIRTL